jgi:hypothetical protein
MAMATVSPTSLEACSTCLLLFVIRRLSAIVFDKRHLLLAVARRFQLQDDVASAELTRHPRFVSKIK